MQSSLFFLVACCLLPASVVASEAGYVLNKTDTKCAHQNNDRLFRAEDLDLEGCYNMCNSTDDCNYFSIALTGQYAGVCMGCKEGHAETHQHFNFYNMPSEGPHIMPSQGPATPAPTPSPTPAPTPSPTPLLGYVLNESDYEPNTKCAFGHPDRLFRMENSNIQDCYLECSLIDSCNYFSIAEEGPYAGVCMGCIEGVRQPHQYFKFFAMPGVSEPQPNQLEHCPNMPYEQRVDCGWWGVTPEACMEKGCCWQVDPVPNPNHIPYCYRQHTAWPSCDVDNSNKTDCGYYGIGADECEERGCCYRQSPVPNPDHVPYCYPPLE